MKTMLKIAAAAVGTAAAAVVLAGVAGPAGAADTATSTHATTLVTVVRPVHANGGAVAGYKVHAESTLGSFGCGDTSFVSVSAGVYWCGSSADNTMACWKSAKHTMLCLRDPRVKDLARIHYDGTLPRAARATHVVPQELTLDNGKSCLIRSGGAWASVKGHPDWYGAYYCTHSPGDLYGPAAHNGIDTSVNPWRVHMLSYYANRKQHLTDYRVAHAYYVGTAS